MWLHCKGMHARMYAGVIIWLLVDTNLSPAANIALTILWLLKWEFAWVRTEWLVSFTDQVVLGKIESSFPANLPGCDTEITNVAIPSSISWLSCSSVLLTIKSWIILFQAAQENLNNNCFYSYPQHFSSWDTKTEFLNTLKFLNTHRCVYMVHFESCHSNFIAK